MTLLPVVLCVAAVVGLLFAEKTSSLAGVWLTKPVAAASYVWFALSLGALETAYGRWLLAGLATCLLGDVFLIPRRHEWFRAGIVAFLAGHLFYIVAFAQLRIAVAGVVVGIAFATALAWLVWRWLGARLSPGFRRLVEIYLVVICSMLIVAFAAAAGSGHFSIAVGAILFALSDVSVARDRFVARELINRLWGLPMYFAAQMILASTVGSGL